MFRLNDAGLVESTGINAGLIEWGGARSLLRTPRYIYGRVTFGMFHTIPWRHFLGLRC